ncbi:MAG: hypothetical protein KBA70_11095 [Aquabacterium sp.]|uniref:hypothetical protein n=1 Tax=Aquabacterium sp. TaxID=1872578 RepID=UPI001B4871F4|nr:hypothetical protein [Aquabacterium sp.]MBP7133290.1 hypothetical protein [Aquabacterium sp.]
MTTEPIESEILEVLTDEPKAAEDTTMEGDFSPAEKEGIAEYQKMLEAMEKGEEYIPPGDDGQDNTDRQADPDASADQQDQATDSVQTEEELSVVVATHAEAVTAAEAALKAAEEKAIALGDQLENGEINQAKYEIEYRRAMREIEAGEGKLASAQTALAQSEAAVEQAAVQSDPWYQAATGFLSDPGNAVFNDGEHHEGLKQAIAFAAGLKQNAEKPPAEIIRIAADTYRAMTGMAKPQQSPAKPESRPAKAVPGIPPMLGQMQAALPNNDDSPFAHLMNLSGPAYEEAYSKLSQAQKDAFMDSLAG